MSSTSIRHYRTFPRGISNKNHRLARAIDVEKRRRTKRCQYCILPGKREATLTLLRSLAEVKEETDDNLTKWTMESRVEGRNKGRPQLIFRFQFGAKFFPEAPCLEFFAGALRAGGTFVEVR